MIDSQMLAAFSSELDLMEKEALLGAAKTLGKSILKRFGRAASKAKKPMGRVRPSRPIPTPSRSSGDLQMLREMNTGSQAAAVKLRGPIGDAYRSAAKSKMTPAQVQARMRSGPKPSMPGGGSKTPTVLARPKRGGGAGVKTQILPPQAAPAGGSTAVVNTLKSTSKAQGRPSGIITAAQSRAAPTKTLLGNIGGGGGAGLSATAYPKGRLLRGGGGKPMIGAGGKPVFAHVMAKFAALHYQSSLVHQIRS